MCSADCKIKDKIKLNLTKMEVIYKVVMMSENRQTNKKYIDKVINVTIEQHKPSRAGAVERIHDKLMENYDTKSRRYKGFEWVVSSIDLK